jgi:hypothetical protein
MLVLLHRRGIKLNIKEQGGSSTSSNNTNIEQINVEIGIEKV